MMARFSPYRIVHLQLAQTFELKTEPQNYYVVFWWQKIPLGHLWIENTQQERDGRDWYNDMLQSIAPAVWYYAALRGDRPEVNIFDLSKENFRLFLSDLFTTPETNEQ